MTAVTRRNMAGARISVPALLVAAVLLLSAVSAGAVSWEWSSLSSKVMDKSAVEDANSDILSYGDLKKVSRSPITSDSAEGRTEGSAPTGPSTADAPESGVPMGGTRGARVAPWGYGLGAKGTASPLIVDELALSLEWIIILCLIGVIIVILIGMVVFCCVFGSNEEVSDEEIVAEVKLPQPKSSTRASASAASPSKKLNDLLTSTVSSKDVSGKGV